ncbi:MAG: hypothetical protein ACYC5O_16975 [Anaerolineae bacterium]
MKLILKSGGRIENRDPFRRSPSLTSDQREVLRCLGKSLEIVMHGSEGRITGKVTRDELITAGTVAASVNRAVDHLEDTIAEVAVRRLRSRPDEADDSSESSRLRFRVRDMMALGAVAKSIHRATVGKKALEVDD